MEMILQRRGNSCWERRSSPAQTKTEWGRDRSTSSDWRGCQRLSPFTHCLHVDFEFWSGYHCYWLLCVYDHTLQMRIRRAPTGAEEPDWRCSVIITLLLWNYYELLFWGAVPVGGANEVALPSTTTHHPTIECVLYRVCEEANMYPM